MVKRRRLDRGAVVEKAAEMADAAGTVQAVTLSALAAALDIRAPSLYNHVASLDDLHKALALYALQQLVARLRAAITEPVGKVGQDALLALADAYRRYALDRPGIYPLTLTAPSDTTSPDDAALTALAQELLQMLLLIFASCGIQGDDALHAIRGMRALLHGFAALEAVEGFKMALDLDESFRRAMAAYLAGLTLPV